MSAPHHMGQCVSARPVHLAVLNYGHLSCAAWLPPRGHARAPLRTGRGRAVWAEQGESHWEDRRMLMTDRHRSAADLSSVMSAGLGGGLGRGARELARTEVGLSAHVLPCVFTVPTSASALTAAYNASRLQVAAGQPRFGVLPAGLVSVSPELVRDTQHADDDHPSARPQPQLCCPELCHPRSHKPPRCLSLITGRVACPSTKIWMRCVRRAPRARLRRNYAGLSTS
jgi:hypothetical protein